MGVTNLQDIVTFFGDCHLPVEFSDVFPHLKIDLLYTQYLSRELCIAIWNLMVKGGRSMNAFQQLVQERQSQAQNQGLNNSIERILRCLDIEVLYGDYSQKKNKVYAVRFRSKLGDGQEAVIFLESELVNLDKKKLSPKQREIKHKLQQMGKMSDIGFFWILDYIDDLILNNLYTTVDNLYTEMNPTDDNKVALKLYLKVKENILNRIDLYPLLRTGNFQKGDPGLIPNTSYYEQKYGFDVVAVTRDHLLQLLDGKNRMPLESILNAWQQMGYLLCPDKPIHSRKSRNPSKPKRPRKKRYQQTISPITSILFYVIQIRGLKIARKRNDGNE